MIRTHKIIEICCIANNKRRNAKLIDKRNIDVTNQNVLNVLTKDLFGKLFADKRYINQSVIETMDLKIYAM